MASNSSGLLRERETYTLGEYVFSIVATRLSDENILAITANVVCDNQRAVKGREFPINAQIDGWYVEANESTADVYVKIKSGSMQALELTLDTYTPNNYLGQYYCGTPVRYHADSTPLYFGNASVPSVVSITRYTDGNGVERVYVATVSGAPGPYHYYAVATFNGTSQVFTPGANGTYGNGGYYSPSNWVIDIPVSTVNPTGRKPIPAIEGGDYLLGRFEIDLETANGGPDGDWDEPGDSGDPSYMLNLTVTGASAGTHNSDSFPLDNETAKGYGCGGDGGHGGGGGAGASTVIIHEFATSRAGNVNQEAYTREPGVGSGGGKGGKGGDGCILIYY